MFVAVKHDGTVLEAQERAHLSFHSPKQRFEVPLLKAGMHHVDGCLAVIEFGFYIFLQNKTLESEGKKR